MRIWQRTSIALSVVAIAAAAPASAQVVDQQQTAHLAVFGGLGYWQGQSFTAGVNTSAGAAFYLENVGTSGTVTIQLWDMLPDQTGASMLASGTGAMTFASGASGWVDAYWTPVAVTPGQQYFLAIFGSGAHGATWYDGGDPYAGGHAYYNYSTTNVQSEYTLYRTDDLTFQEYASATTTTPEPGSLALVGTGLVGLLPVVRRKFSR